MSVRPILAALRRHKIAAFLIVLEIALAFAIVSNAVYLVMGRLQRMDIRSGIDEPAGSGRPREVSAFAPAWYADNSSGRR